MVSHEHSSLPPELPELVVLFGEGSGGEGDGGGGGGGEGDGGGGEASGCGGEGDGGGGEASGGGGSSQSHPPQLQPYHDSRAVQVHTCVTRQYVQEHEGADEEVALEPASLGNTQIREGCVFRCGARVACLVLWDTEQDVIDGLVCVRIRLL